VDDALMRTVGAVVERDAGAAAEVQSAEVAINRLHGRIRERGFAILLRQSPVARDLRGVLAATQMGAELERIGDHCAGIAGRTLALCALDHDLHAPRRHAIGRLGALCIAQVRDILGAVLRCDGAEATRVAAADDGVDAAYHAAVDDILRVMREDPHVAPAATHLLFIAHALERIGDRVTNIAEDIVSLTTGRVEKLD
ncbi:MAG TPA: phosphate signaling complex protein PhoU, partial [Candidatus Dormibacteraeota bacterium]|nr:phosphate signaling complex protein PhoU [Candidatus Dormibacteraeota bacterium]